MSGLAIAGFVMALTLWLIPILGPAFALLLSILGWRQIRDVAANRSGLGFAIAGATMAAIQLALWLSLFLFPVFAGETTKNPDGSTSWSYSSE